MKDHDSLRRWCAQPQEDDGVDPRRFFDRRRSHTNDKRVRQLCRQAFEALSLSLPEQDRSLAGVRLVAVRPGRDGSQLVATFGVNRALRESERRALECALARHRGRLRAEIARAVTRRHAPDLMFEIVEMGGAQ